MSVDTRLMELGLELPEPFPAAGSYVGAVRSGSLLFVSGTGPVRADGSVVTGKVGDTVDLDAAVDAARLTALQLLAVMRRELGSLDRVHRIVKTLGMVNCAPGFNRTPQVIDGCSNLLIDVFGEAGRGARSAVGMAELPFDIAVEIELVAEVTD
jgi:enamine deaminase RidA (YjgF/YER057c/UK114 family)